ncbi:MAG: TetR/AcrR family transcriptional regulator [Pseudomonadota bacterium]
MANRNNLTPVQGDREHQGRERLGSSRFDEQLACAEPKGLGRRPSTSDTICDIQRAAREEFAKYGFDRATVEGIARKAKVSKQLLYYYYDNKAELYATILEEAAAQTSAFSNEPNLNDREPEEALRTYIDNIFSDYIRRPQIIQMTMDEAQHGFSHVAKRGSLASLLQGAIIILEDIIKRGQDDGTFRADVEPDALFWTIFSMVTAWFSHAPMISLVSGAKLEGERGLAYWRVYSGNWIARSVLKCDTPNQPREPSS